MTMLNERKKSHKIKQKGTLALVIQRILKILMSLFIRMVE